MSLYITRVLVGFARFSSKKYASYISTRVKQVSTLYTTFVMALGPPLVHLPPNVSGRELDMKQYSKKADRNLYPPSFAT